MINRGLLLGLLTFLLVLSYHTHGQDLIKEQKKLLNYQQSVLTLQNDKKKLEEKLSLSKAKIESLEAAVAPFAKARDQSKIILDEAEAEAKTNPSGEALAKIDNAKFKYFLAQRKFNKVNGKLKRTQEVIQKLTEQIKKNQLAFEGSNKNINKQQARIAWLEQQQEQRLVQEKEVKTRQTTIEKQQREEARRQKEEEEKRTAELDRRKTELAESEAKNIAAQNEIAYLKALLAAKEKEIAEAAAAKAQTAEAQSAANDVSEIRDSTTAPDAPHENAQEVAKTGDEQLPITAIVTSPAEKEIPDLVEGAVELLETPSAQEAATDLVQAITMAKKEHAMIKQRLGDMSPRLKRSRVTKILHIKTFVDGKAPKTTSHSLDFIGEGLYQAALKVRSGSNAFTIGKNRWQKIIPDTDNRAVYVITYDTQDVNQPRLIMYNKAYVE